MKKLLITGITGLLGSNLAYILKNDFKLCGISRGPFNMPQVRTKQLNLIDHGIFYDYIEEVRPDVLIHTAAITNVDLCEEDRELARIVNAQVTGFVAEKCRALSTKLIYISTDSVFDGKKNGLYTECDDTNTINEYAKTKLLGENYVLRNTNSLVLRTNFYGFNYQNKYSFAEWILHSLQGDHTINLFEDIFFSPILVNDMAHLINIAIRKDISGLYNLCGTGKISKHDFGIYLKERFRIPSGIILKSRSEDSGFKAKRPQNMGMSNKKICKDLNVSIRTPREGIDRFYELYCSGYRERLIKE